MWVVYYKEDSPYVGWEVSTEEEAIEECREDENLRYCYVDYGCSYGYGYEEYYG